MNRVNYLQNIKSDIPASIVVFFVAIPLCLGIALASGAPLFSGIIAGIIGGILVGLISGSQIGVSGPAAGLAAIVLSAIGTLGSFENFLVAVVLGGAIQLAFGILRAGVIGQYFPSSVIKGMLTGIGLIIILKQIPHFFGYDNSTEGDLGFIQTDGETTFSALSNTFSQISLGSTTIALVSLIILILWDSVLTKKAKIFQLIQGPLVAVVFGIIYTFTTAGNEIWGIAPKFLVSVPESADISSLLGNFTFPNFSSITDINVWVVGFTIALVASLETLLCVEATDKLDPEKRVTPKNRELIAQGIGNMFSGLIGGLPVTQVIVRSSANIQSGGKTKIAAILHGILLVISIVSIPQLLNKIPLSVLAAILLIVGYKLAKPTLFKSMYKLGWKQFIPFLITVVGIIFTDLLLGIFLGLIVGVAIILKESYRNSHSLNIEENSDGRHNIVLQFAEEVTFINKAPISRELESLPLNTNLKLDVTRTKFLDNDIIEILNDFLETTSGKNINFTVLTKKGEFENPKNMSHIFTDRKKSA